MKAPRRALSPIQADALREMANIGSGHAATVLSQLTGLHIMIDVPRVCVAPFEGLTGWLPEKEQALAVLGTRMLGDLAGDTYFLLPEAGARSLADLLLGRPVGSGGPLLELERSSLVEAGNIVASSFMNALARAVGRLLMPSVPRLDLRTHGEWHNSHADSDYVLLVETRFHFRAAKERGEKLSPEVEESLRGAFVFAPNTASFDELLTILLGEVPAVA
jgi:chemotaxis protein CheC